MTRAVDRAIEHLTEAFAARFPEGVAVPRTVGREAEFTVVRPDGRAADCQTLWPRLLAHPRLEPLYDQPAPDGSELLIGARTELWTAIAEVGRGTLEISVGPRRSLIELGADLDRALAVLHPITRRAGYRVLGYGIQPRTPPVRTILTPKQRYLAFLGVVGRTWLRFGLTASDQLHIALSREELVPAMNLLNAVSGAIIAVSANSSVYGGRPGAFASGREGLMRRLVAEPFRHGAVPRPFRDLEDYVRWACGFRCLVLPSGKGFRFPTGTFAAELSRSQLDLETFLYHEHYLWPSARPRARLGTLEIRPACQQPGASFAAAAFALGLAEAHRDAWAYLQDALGRELWPSLLTYRRRAVRLGLRAQEPVPGFLGMLLDLAEHGLAARGLGEERLLLPIRERVETRCGPADHARDLMRAGGIEALVAELALRPVDH